MNLRDLRYAVAVAEEGHFGRAAARCHVSQPTLSAQIKKLEAELGVTLFERGKRHIAPTPPGERIVAQARRVLEEADRLPELARAHAEPLGGPLVLGVIPTVGPYLLPALIGPLKEAYPRLEPVVREDLTADLLAALAEHALDAALVALPVEAPGLVHEPLYDEPFVVILPQGHPLAAKEEITDADLAHERLLLLDEGHCFREQALAVCGMDGPKGAEAGPDFRAASLETVRRMVAAGLGVSLLPVLALGGPQDGRAGLKVRPFHPPVPKRRIGMVWRRQYPRAEALRALADFIRANLPEGVKPVARRPASGPVAA